MFELADAVLCKTGRVHMLAELSLEPECRRGHGALYDAVNCGDVQFARLRRVLAGLPLSAWPDGRIRLGHELPAGHPAQRRGRHHRRRRPRSQPGPDREHVWCYGAQSYRPFGTAAGTCARSWADAQQCYDDVIGNLPI